MKNSSELKKFEFIEAVPNQLYNNNNDKIEFKCTKCTTTKAVVIKSVLTGYTQSVGCGCKPKVGKPHIPPTSLSVEQWNTVFINYNSRPKDINDLLGLSRNSGKEVKFICECGREFDRKICKIKQSSTCGECDKIELKTGKQIRNFKYIGEDKFINSNSYHKVRFQCQCGNESSISFKIVYNGSQKTCGQCNKTKYEGMIGKKVGNLTIVEITGSKPRKDGKTSIYALCNCICGNEREIEMSCLLSGKKLTCGVCYDVGLSKRREWIEEGSNTKNFTNQLIELLDQNIKQKNRFLCKMCGRIFESRFSDIKRGKVISCGCLNHKISKPNIELKNWLNLQGIKVEMEKYIGDGFYLDLYLPEHSIAVEINGLYWYKDEKQKILEKKRICDSKDIRLFVIYEDEIKEKSFIIRNMVLNACHKNVNTTKLRMKECSVHVNSGDNINPFLEKYHIQGYRNHKHRIIIKHKNVVVGCMLIDRPIRQNCKHDWEIVRMVSRFDYRVHGMWSFVLKHLNKFIDIDGVLATYSDNRISDGNVYKVMGMAKYSEITQDYFWCDGRKRYSKSSMRKNKEYVEMNMTENQYWESKGITKIWDLGKIKWQTEIHKL